MKKPFSLQLALFIMWPAFLLQLGLLLFGLLKEWDTSVAVPALAYEAVLVVSLYLTSSGRSYARTIFTCLMLVPFGYLLVKVDWALSSGDIRQLAFMLAPIIPLAMLWNPAASRWFALLAAANKAGKAASGTCRLM